MKMVLDNSLTLAEWEIHPETPGADPGRIMGQTLHALVRARVMRGRLPLARARTTRASRRPGSTGSSTGG